MATKPIKLLELHYAMTQFLITIMMIIIIIIIIIIIVIIILMIILILPHVTFKKLKACLKVNVKLITNNKLIRTYDRR